MGTEKKTSTRRPYEAPTMQCYTSTEILASLGPALAAYKRSKEQIHMALPPMQGTKR